MAETTTQILLKVMIPIYLVTSLVLSATYARAVVPRRRILAPNSHLVVSVRPKVVDFYMDDTVEVKCRSKGGYEVEDHPFISFYRQLSTGNEETVFPLSSGYPGVSIEAQAATSHSQHRRGRSLKVLTLHSIAWHTLDYGRNLFYCRASTINGETQMAYFVVNKLRRWDE